MFDFPVKLKIIILNKKMIKPIKTEITDKRAPCQPNIYCSLKSNPRLLVRLKTT